MLLRLFGTPQALEQFAIEADRDRVLACGLTADEADCWEWTAKAAGKFFALPKLHPMDAQEVALGWWPGSDRYPKAAYYGFAHPAPEGFGGADLRPDAARWDGDQGLYLLDWDDAIASDDPQATAVDFAYSVFNHSCRVCQWDPELAATAQGVPPPVS